MNQTRKNAGAVVVVALLSLLLASCNIWAPFASSSSTAGIEEEALKCLHKNDFDCAITQYSKLPDGQLKRQKLCTVNMSKAGFTLNSFLNIVGNGSGEMLGALANAVKPWTTAKELAAVEAAKQCDSFYTNVDRTVTEDLQFAALLSMLGNFLNCSIRIAKTDQFQATAEDNSVTFSSSDKTTYYSDPTSFTTNCQESDLTSNSASNGTIEKADVGPATTPATSVLSSSTPGMCSFDVLVCQSIISSVSSLAGELGGSSGSTLKSIEDTFSQIDSALTSLGSGKSTVRFAIRDSISAR